MPAGQSAPASRSSRRFRPPHRRQTVSPTVFAACTTLVPPAVTDRQFSPPLSALSCPRYHTPLAAATGCSTRRSPSTTAGPSTCRKVRRKDLLAGRRTAPPAGSAAPSSAGCDFPATISWIGRCSVEQLLERSGSRNINVSRLKWGPPGEAICERHFDRYVVSIQPSSASAAPRSSHDCRTGARTSSTSIDRSCERIHHR